MRSVSIIILSIYILLTFSCKVHKKTTEDNTKQIVITNQEIENLRSSDEKYKGGPANDIQLIGILEEELFFPAPCDDEQNNAAVYKYTVDKIVKGEYKKNQILLIETCPEIKGGRFFRKNVKYKITANINKYNSYDWVIFNYYQGSDIPVYWSITIEKSNY